MDYLIETSIVRALFGNDERVMGRLAAIRLPDQVYTSVITQGELLHGAAKAFGARSRTLSSQIAEFLDTVADVLPVTRAVASAYATVKRDLEARGKLIPINDLWIAATAISGGLTLVAHDEHFTRIEALRLEDWLA